MTLPPLSTLLAIAQAASDVPISAVGALAHYEQTFSPPTCLALLEQLAHATADRDNYREGHCTVTIGPSGNRGFVACGEQDESGKAHWCSEACRLRDRVRQLEAVLVEALDYWEGWDSGSGTSADCDRLAELRKLAAGGTVRP